ncbi:MAG TPA: BON domain-containing protein [Albitalea sp.]
MSPSQRCFAGLLSGALVLGTAGCAHDTSFGQKFDDTTITTKVKTALLADPDVKGTSVTVETLRGQVQLSGFVESAAQARRAVEIASRVDGVRKVENKMSVKP